MVTINEIAKKCGVSTATVSYVLNGKSAEKRISAATRESVNKAARELGYKGHRVKKATKASANIGFFWQDNDFDMVVPSVVNGINHVLSSSGVPANVMIRPFTVGHLGDVEQLFDGTAFDAVVLTGLNEVDLDYISANRPTAATVLVNRSLPGFSDVSTDSEEVGRLSAEHAMAVTEDIAVILNPKSFTCMNKHGQTFMNICRDRGIDFSNRIYYCDNTMGSAYSLGLELAGKGRLNKLYFCSYDMVALGLMNAFTESGVRVGTDIQVFCASNGPDELFAYCTPSLTVVDQRMSEIVERSLRLAIDFTAQQVLGEQHQRVYPKIIYRKSSPAVIKL